jgi:hypothetical protein
VPAEEPVLQEPALPDVLALRPSKAMKGRQTTPPLKSQPTLFSYPFSIVNVGLDLHLDPHRDGIQPATTL